METSDVVFKESLLPEVKNSDENYPEQPAASTIWAIIVRKSGFL